MILKRPDLALLVLFAVLLAGILAAGGVNTGPSLPKPATDYKWVGVFSDEFAGNSLNPQRWATCYDWFNYQYNGCSNTGNHELEWYLPQEVKVGHGYAQLTAVKQNTIGLFDNYEYSYPYRSGMISTGGPLVNGTSKTTFTYGYFEARLKTTSGKGVWPAFWLLPPNGKWPPEIDVMEILGDKPNSVLMTYHWGSSYQPQKDKSDFNKLSDPNGWHTYAVNWQPGRIDWYIDGIERKSVQSRNVPNQPLELIADLAIGGDLPGPPNNRTTLPASLKIDYIRVYQQVKK